MAGRRKEGSIRNGHALKVCPSVRWIAPVALVVGLCLASPVWAADPPPAAPAGLQKDLPKESNGIDLTGTPAASLMVDPTELERQAEDAAAQAEAEKKKADQEFNRKSFERASGGILPLSADQIREFMKRLENTQEAAVAPSAGPPKGEVKVMNLNLDPGASLPLVNLTAGSVTTIDFVDASGEPWPILDVGVGGSFEVTPTTAGSHVVRVMPLTRVGTGDLSILLKDLSTPVVIRLSTGGASFHLRYDVRVPKLGPNAKAPIIARPRGVTAGDEVITMILQNAPPPEAKRLKVAGLDARTMAWQINSKVYVRSPLTLLSPAWNASVASADGTSVYEIGDAPVLLMSDNGALVRARLSRDEKP